VTSALCPNLQIFRLYLINCKIFEKNLEIKMRFAIFSTTLSGKVLILRRSERMIKNAYGLHVRYVLFFSDFNESWIFSTYFRKILKYQTSWNSSSRSRVRRTDRRDEAKVAFRNFAKAPKTNKTLKHYFLILSNARNIIHITHPHCQTEFPISTLLFE
jgi:hypothetical protein